MCLKVQSFTNNAISKGAVTHCQQLGVGLDDDGLTSQSCWQVLVKVHGILPKW